MSDAIHLHVQAEHCFRLFNLMAAFEAPDDEPNTGSRRIPERHGRAGVGFHRLNSVSRRGLPYGQNEWRFRATP